MTTDWLPGAKPLAADELLTVLTDNPVVVVHFWAAWNEVDRRFAEELDSVRSEFTGRVAFRSANVDDETLAAFCEEIEVGNVPTLGCFAGGRLVKTMVGSRSAGDLRKEFAALLVDASAEQRVESNLPAGRDSALAR